jgi:hypothetical protein
MAEIELLSAQEDGIWSAIGTSRAISTVHSVQTDTIQAATTSLAVAEGADATLSALTTPARDTNITEILSKSFGVSGTQRAVTHYGFEDAYTYQVSKAMKEWLNAAEFDLVRSTLTSGASGTVPKMNGIIAKITTNATAQASGTIFSESIMNGLLDLTWTNSNGEVATDIYVGSWLKRKISGFAGRSGTQAIVDNKSVVNTIDMYFSDFGSHRVHLHRYVFVSGTDVTQRFLAIRPEKWAKAILRDTKVEELAKVGDSTRGQVIGELTLEAKNERCSTYASGYNLAL